MSVLPLHFKFKKADPEKRDQTTHGPVSSCQGASTIHRNWEIQRGKFLGPVGHLKGSEALLGSPELRAVPAHQNGFVSLQSTVVSHGVKSGSLTLKHPILFFKDSL